jgi:hypothetical protein
MNSPYPIAALLALALATAAPLRAQHAVEPARGGFHLELGGGGGTAGCAEYCGGGAAGGEARLFVGAGVSPRLVAGLELAVADFDGAVDIGYGQVGAGLQYYPAARGRFFLRGSAGVMAAGIDGELGIGAAFGAGVGYHLPLSRSVALTPTLGLRLAAPGTTLHSAIAGVALTLP